MARKMFAMRVPSSWGVIRLKPLVMTVPVQTTCYQPRAQHVSHHHHGVYDFPEAFQPDYVLARRRENFSKNSRYLGATGKPDAHAR